jgi:hypothetical protein
VPDVRWNRLPALGIGAVLAVSLAWAGCHRPGAIRDDRCGAGAPGQASEAPGAEGPAGEEAVAYRHPPAPGEEEGAETAPGWEAPGPAPAGTPEAVPAPPREERDGEETVSAPAPAVAAADIAAAPSPRGPDRVASLPPATATQSGVPGRAEQKEARGVERHRIRAVVALLPEHLAFPRDGPSWAREKEELVYRVEFLGLTMGYARLTFRGKVLLEGREAYHLTVRAWTSELLSLVYPMNDTIEYYLDVETFAPLRVEFTRARKEDDIAFYDQERGSIVYRYKRNGNIRKTVDAVPGVYDPVSVAYFFRSRDAIGTVEPRPLYGGKKLYDISARLLGHERIRTERGEFDTILVQPVLRTDGKVDDKGDLRLWMTKDDRHLPVRLYAKFRKVRTWTLVGELLPAPQEG